MTCPTGICFGPDLPIFPEMHRAQEPESATVRAVVRTVHAAHSPPVNPESAQIAAAFGRTVEELHRLEMGDVRLTTSAQIAAAFGNTPEDLRRFGDEAR